MNRLKAVSMLVALGSIAIVTVLTSQATQAIGLHASSAHMVGPSQAPSTPIPGIVCVVPFTTTSSIGPNYTLETALLVAQCF